MSLADRLGKLEKSSVHSNEGEYATWCQTDEAGNVIKTAEGKLMRPGGFCKVYVRVSPDQWDREVDDGFA